MTALARVVRSARGLSAAEWGLFAEAWLRLLAADVSLRLRPRKPLAHGALSDAPEARAASVDERVVRMLLLAARHHVVPANCLRRSLALRAMLVRRGVPAVLRVGARLDGGLVAHAWVEVGGCVVGDSEREIAKYGTFEPGRTAAPRRPKAV